MRRIIAIAGIALFFLGLSITPAHALGLGDSSTYAQKAASTAQISTNQSLENIIASMIQTLLGLIGVVFFLLALWAGWTWMISAGEAEKVKKAKALILNAAIGLLITLAAYSITYFIARAVEQAIP